METQVKSKQRVADHGEVFTAEREVKAMCDLVNDQTQILESRFLEPACGDGNFLAEILTRKLNCKRLDKYKKIPSEWEKYSLIALGSLYGVDIMADNAQICRDRLFSIWQERHKKICKKEQKEGVYASAKFILQRNIVCGNALSLMCVDENQQDTEEPIIFSEWSFPFNDYQIQRKDYSFAEMLKDTDEKKKKNRKSDDNQMSLFSENEDPEEKEPEFIQQYMTMYWRLGENG